MKKYTIKICGDIVDFSIIGSELSDSCSYNGVPVTQYTGEWLGLLMTV
jgi:hypothetical protein